MAPDTIIAQCPTDGQDLRWSDLFAPPRQIGRLVQLHVQCPRCKARRRLRMHPDDLRQTARVWDQHRPQMIGDAVAYFRNILDDINEIDDIVEWKDLA